jgi:hypothetical protein
MKRRWLLAAILAASVASALAARAAWTGQDSRVIRLEGRSTSFVTIDNAPKGPSIGDSFVFTDNLYSGGKKVGRDQGTCYNTIHQEKECSGSVILADGRIAIESAFNEAKAGRLVNAVLGGTGAYRDARGAATVIARSGGRTLLVIDLR